MQKCTQMEPLLDQNFKIVVSIWIFDILTSFHQKFCLPTDLLCLLGQDALIANVSN